MTAALLLPLLLAIETPTSLLDRVIARYSAPPHGIALEATFTREDRDLDQRRFTRRHYQLIAFGSDLYALTDHSTLRIARADGSVLIASHKKKSWAASTRTNPATAIFLERLGSIRQLLVDALTLRPDSSHTLRLIGNAQASRVRLAISSPAGPATILTLDPATAIVSRIDRRFPDGASERITFDKVTFDADTRLAALDFKPPATWLRLLSFRDEFPW